MGFLFELSAGAQQQAAYNYNSDINERNAQVADTQAEQLVFQEEQNIVDFRKQFDDLQAATQSISVQRLDSQRGYTAQGRPGQCPRG